MDVIYVVPMQTVDRKNKYPLTTFIARGTYICFYVTWSLRRNNKNKYKFRFSWLLLYYVVEFILNKIWDKGAFAFELDK